LTSVRGVEKLEAGTPDGESNEKEKVEEMEKDVFVTRCIVDGMSSYCTLLYLLNVVIL